MILKGLSGLSHSAIVGLATALENAYPMCYPCAREDIASYAWVKSDEEARIFLYDNSAGGLALTWPAVEELDADIFGKDFAKLAESINDMDISDEVLISTEPHQMVGIRGIDDTTYEAFSVEWVRPKDRTIRVKRENRSISTSPTGFVIVKERVNNGTVYRKARWGNDMEMWHTTVAVTTVTNGFRERVNNTWVNQEKYPNPLSAEWFLKGSGLNLARNSASCPKMGLTPSPMPSPISSRFCTPATQRKLLLTA